MNGDKGRHLPASQGPIWSIASQCCQNAFYGAVLVRRALSAAFVILTIKIKAGGASRC